MLHHLRPLKPPLSDVSAAASAAEDHIFRLITGHPRPSHLFSYLPLTQPLISRLLSRLHLSHSPALLSLSLLLHSLLLPLPPSPSSLHSTLLTLSRARLFPSSLLLLRRLLLSHPSLLSPLSLSLLLFPHSKSHPFSSTLHLFDELRDSYRSAGIPFGVDEFNVLLRAFCAQRRMGEARHVFTKYSPCFPPNSRTFNTLLLGFKKAGDLMALDLFYHEMVARGFQPDVISYNIRIDAYCKKGRLLQALEQFRLMEGKGILPTVETMTTLIHGAGIARDAKRARELFDEMLRRGLCADVGAYNALIGSFVRVGELKAAVSMLDEMEEEGIELNDVSYYTVFLGLKKFVGRGGMESACKIYERMMRSKFVPPVRTVMLLMKMFCENKMLDMGLELWDYTAERGGCLHRHVLDVLVTGLCCGGRWPEAYRCFKQVVERGNRPSERGFRVLERFLMKAKEVVKLEEVAEMMRKLESISYSEFNEFNDSSLDARDIVDSMD